MPNKININRASIEDLCQLEGIAEATAKRIVTFRKQIGHFNSPDELTLVKGISSNKVKKLKPRFICSIQRTDYKLIDHLLKENKGEVSASKSRERKVYRTKPISFKRTNEARKLLFQGGKKLSEQNLKEAASSLGIDLACIKAVIEVESSGGGFLSNGKVKILFEGHVFWRQLLKRNIPPEKFVSKNQNILYNKWNRSHYLSGWAEYRRLQKAKLIHKEAALESASWGMFQFMGFNYRLAGFKSVKEFVQNMEHSEQKQLQAFINFIRNKGLVKKLQNKNWEGFARSYNGAGFKKNKYDTKLASAYRRHKTLVK